MILGRLQKYRDQGFIAGPLDLIIAAIALHHDAEIVTFDADIFAISAASILRVRLLSRPCKRRVCDHC